MEVPLPPPSFKFNIAPDEYQILALPSDMLFKKGDLIAKAFLLDDSTWEWFVGRINVLTKVGPWCKFEDGESKQASSVRYGIVHLCIGVIAALVMFGRLNSARRTMGACGPSFKYSTSRRQKSKKRSFPAQKEAHQRRSDMGRGRVAGTVRRTSCRRLR